jgi:hypothetical protein
MARDHARLALAIWDDDDFRGLSGNAQHLYLILLMHPDLSYCGVTDWRPAKLAGMVADWTADTVREAAVELIDRLYIVVDEDTEEVLVRSFVRHDGLMKQPKMATAMSSAYAVVGSVPLRQVIVWELRRLHEEDPDINGWHSEKATALLDRPSVNPSTYPCGNPTGKGSGNPTANPSTNPSVYPSGNPSGNPNPNPSTNPSGKGSTKGSPTPSSYLLAPDEELRKEVGVQGEEVPPADRATRVPDDFAPSDDLVAWGKDLGFTETALIDIAAEFVDYWRAKPGKDGLKRDWNATFRNWVRKEDPAKRNRKLRPVASTGGWVKPSWEL